ncbi:MAG: hypothetical protein Q4C12_08460 [Clostridia bacterium]|nr:hypothetical protein [Clostridia bacterium]
MLNLLRESCRRCDCSRRRIAEWTSEGNQNGEFPKYVRRSEALR